MRSDFLITEKSSILRPVSLTGIACMEGVNPEILLSIHDFVNNREVVRKIPVVKFSPKTLQTTVEAANGCCVKAKELHEALYNEYKEKLVEQTVEVSMEHQKLGWSFDEDGNLEFRGQKIISTLPRKYESVYSGRKDLLAPRGSIKELVDMINRHIIGTVEWSPLEAIIAFGAGATVLPYANKMWGKNINNHIIHLIGSGTTGKSTSLELFVGLGSNPLTKEGYFLSHVSTENALVRKIGDNIGFPVGIDELTGKSRRKSKKHDEFVYTIGNGEEKDRLGAGGKELQNAAVFNTLFLSSGESSLLDKCSNLEGIYSRATEFSHVLWTESKEQSDAIKTCMHKNYGAVTMLVASELLSASVRWKLRWDYWQDRVDEKIAKDKIVFSIRDRVAQYVVLSCTAAEIVNQVLGVRLDVEEIFKFCFLHFLVAKASEANLAERACDYVKSFISRNHAKIVDYVAWNIVGEAVPLDDEDIGFTYTVRKPRPVKGVECNRVYAIRRQIFEDILAAGNFPIKVTLHKLREENYLMTQGKRNYDKVYTVNGVDVPFVVIFVPDRSYGGIGFEDDEDDLKDVA